MTFELRADKDARERVRRMEVIDSERLGVPGSEEGSSSVGHTPEDADLEREERDGIGTSLVDCEETVVNLRVFRV